MRRWLALVSAAVLLITSAVLAWIGFMDRSAEEGAPSPRLCVLRLDGHGFEHSELHIHSVRLQGA
jgi:hypothetical protein